MKYQSDVLIDLKGDVAQTIRNIVATLIGTLRSEDGYGRENVAEKVN